jgi:hypothetical protein
VGWAVKSKHDLMIGKLLATSYFVNQWRVSDQRSGDTVDVAMKVAPIWLTGAAFRWGSRFFRTGVAFVGANPVTAVVTYAYVAGAITSDAIDPEEGLDNYIGFTTGGAHGNQPNYVTGDANDSGYFNVVQNFANILKAKRAAKAAKKQKALEAAYIQDYWMNAHLETLTQNWLAMTQEERDAVNAGWQGRASSSDYQGRIYPDS